MKGSYAAMLVARPVRRSLGITVVDGTLAVVPVFWSFVDLMASLMSRETGRTSAAEREGRPRDNTRLGLLSS